LSSQCASYGNIILRRAKKNSAAMTAETGTVMIHAETIFNPEIRRKLRAGNFGPESHVFRSGSPVFGRLGMS
jgi:hypothetical protein